jgi:hypothetical protein
MLPRDSAGHRDLESGFCREYAKQMENITGMLIDCIPENTAPKDIVITDENIVNLLITNEDAVLANLKPIDWVELLEKSVIVKMAKHYGFEKLAPKYILEPVLNYENAVAFLTVFFASHKDVKYHDMIPSDERLPVPVFENVNDFKRYFLNNNGDPDTKILDRIFPGEGNDDSPTFLFTQFLMSSPNHVKWFTEEKIYKLKDGSLVPLYVYIETHADYTKNWAQLAVAYGYKGDLSPPFEDAAIWIQEKLYEQDDDEDLEAFAEEDEEESKFIPVVESIWEQSDGKPKTIEQIHAISDDLLREAVKTPEILKNRAHQWYLEQMFRPQLLLLAIGLGIKSIGGAEVTLLTNKRFPTRKEIIEELSKKEHLDFEYTEEKPKKPTKKK